jgi:hypothetical protein
MIRERVNAGFAPREGEWDQARRCLVDPAVETRVLKASGDAIVKTGLETSRFGSHRSSTQTLPRESITRWLFDDLISASSVEVP